MAEIKRFKVQKNDRYLNIFIGFSIIIIISSIAAILPRKGETTPFLYVFIPLVISSILYLVFKNRLGDVAFYDNEGIIEAEVNFTQFIFTKRTYHSKVVDYQFRFYGRPSRNGMHHVLELYLYEKLIYKSSGAGEGLSDYERAMIAKEFEKYGAKDLDHA